MLYANLVETYHFSISVAFVADCFSVFCVTTGNGYIFDHLKFARLYTEFS